VKTCMLILAALALLPGVARADSPVTSTPFSDAYLDVPIIRQAKASGLLNDRFADYLSSPMIAIDRKAALCNALSWQFGGKSNAKLYGRYLLARHAARIATQPHVTADEYFCLGYLFLLDDYFSPAKALPWLETARRRNTKSFTVAIVLALCKAQVALDSDWDEVWRATRRVELDRRLKPDLRPAARQIVFDYMNLYRPNQKPGKETMMEMPKGPLCQSCGMPMEKPEQFGTEANKSPSPEYCTYCYQAGKFIDPTMTYEKMLAFDTGFLAKEMKTSEPEAKKFVESWLPHLKRWKKQ